VLTPLILGSRSSFEPLRAGTELPCQAGIVQGRSIRLGTKEDSYLQHLAGTGNGPTRLRALDGPQADWFEGQGFWTSVSAPRLFEVQSASNRMGLRLFGSPLAGPDREMVSEPVCPGAVQVTHDGQCIILGIDGQTIGGYPKVAQVIGADLDLVGQLRPGDRIQFERVDLWQAEELFHRKRAFLREWAVRFQEAELF
jgi:antagonist of KipI